jgi:hypothetical protein
VLVVVALVAASVVVLVGTRRLEDHIDELDRRWRPLRADLAIRYERLQELHDVYRDETGGEGRLTRDLQALLDEWQRLRGLARIDYAGEARTANELELAARRMLESAVHGTVLTPALEQAFVRFTRSLIPSPELPRYNRETTAYENTRDSILGAPAAHLLGFYGRARLGLTL